ncbi:hypothetical protein PHYBOEH_001817 [Phytophthora boehmeriae]|uniref:RxLR effector protein n=1 Tax=Phytophthora boehmeriae TaxID=109152 RepID=A0A8T1V736_9STRA|nr:hypothetical protein PHYBOEH_001817 [Phytophthora boehmeriae]
MRLCYSLLAIAVTLLVKSSAAATNAKVSQLVSADNSFLTQELTHAKTDNAKKRFLRSKVDDEDSMGLDRDGEERGLLAALQNAVKQRQQNKALKEIEKAALKALYESGENPTALYRSLSLARKSKDHLDYKTWKKFEKYYNKIEG